MRDPNKTSYRFIALLLALVVALAGMGLNFQPAQAQTCTQFYTVRSGDTLWGIGQRFDIPWPVLAEINNLQNPRQIFPGQVLCVATTDSEVIPDTGLQPDSVPVFDVIGVETNEAVTVRTRNFPANVVFEVRMGRGGTRAIDGVLVGRINSGAGGAFLATFEIPEQLHDLATIAIRFDSPTAGWFSFNFFANRTSGQVIPDTGVRPVAPPRDRVIAQLPGDPAAVNRSIQRVFFQEEVDLFAGNAGVFMPNSAFSANLSVERLRSTNVPGQLRFHQNWLNVQMFDLQGNAFERVFGLVYVYFNLDNRTRQLWDAGDLQIYRHDESQRGWAPCGVTVLIETKNQPHGRLSCVASNWGLYGLAEAQ